MPTGDDAVADDDAEDNGCHADESEDGVVDADDGAEHSEIPAANEDSDDGAVTGAPLDTAVGADCDEPLADRPSAADDASKLSEASETAASFTVRGREWGLHSVPVWGIRAYWVGFGARCFLF